MTADKIFDKGDGTPYYIISLFKIFRGREMTLQDLNQLPSDVTALWRNYLERAIQNSMIKVDHLNAFRSLGLLSHASSEPSYITKSMIHEVYGGVFHGNLGTLDYAVDDLVDYMFVSRDDKGYYYADGSHIEALESKYPIEKHHVQDFIKHERDSGNLWAFVTWADYSEKMEYSYILYSRIIEIEPSDRTAWDHLGLTLLTLVRYEEAIACYDKVIELKCKLCECLEQQRCSSSFFSEI